MSPAPPPAPDRPVARLEDRLTIEPDGTIVGRSGKVEYGQNIRAGFARIIAEELDVRVDRVRIELGDTMRVPWDMGTFGSMSTAVDGAVLRAAAQFARGQLVLRASARLNVPAGSLVTREGLVVAPDLRTISYAELTAGDPLTGPIPEYDATARPAATAADTPERVEARAIVTGAARYAADVRLPGLLRGHVLAPPVWGARLEAVDDRGARKLPGVRAIIREGEFVGVVADRDEQAVAAVHALEATWSPPEPPGTDIATVVLRRDEGLDTPPAPGAIVFEAHYFVPHIAHAPIGPGAAVADVRADGVDLYVSTQRPFGLREEVSRLLARPEQDIRVHPQLMSGTFGRTNRHDVALEAARLSRAVERPVLVQWTRPEEFQLSPQRPMLEADVHASISPDGAIAAWRYRARTNPHAYGGDPAVTARFLELTAGRNAVPPYRLGRADVQVQVVPGDVRTGPYRSLAAAPHVFAIESFVDEVARAIPIDPIELRLQLIDSPRLRRVLETVRERSAWSYRTHEDGRGFGVACAIYHGTAIAQVAEVVVATSGRVHLERVWCALDPGRLVHPDGARQQIEGGIQQAASWALLEELRHHDGEVTTTTWREYPIATFLDAPRNIDVAFTPDSAAASSGIGEAGSVPTAAAIANAVFDACGARVRRLPLAPTAVAAAKR